MSVRTPTDSSSSAVDHVQDWFQGCLLGGAVSDALGAPVEFMTCCEILRRFGLEGITNHTPAYGGLSKITNHMQMTLFTAEGLIRGCVRACQHGTLSMAGTVGHAYLRWLLTQDEQPRGNVDRDGWLFKKRRLQHRRTPGNTCLSVLWSTKFFGEASHSDSEGCGGVIRAAPAGLFQWSLGRRDSSQHAFALGSELAMLRHGHPTGALTAGVLAVLMLLLVDGASLAEALTTARSCLQQAPDHEETLNPIEQAEQLAASDLPHHDAIARLGQGWNAEEALAISIYCALVASDFRHGVILAMNHDGDSGSTGSTGSIVGNPLGAMHGARVIPLPRLKPLELRNVIDELARNLFDFATWDISPDAEHAEFDERMLRKYLGC